eukprot:TRINITY_DN28009_c0_g1_i1.p2 TRINITY_DN28009_c0_g1~~TRINITY_DN28009_c0_g1_i1.p2  ORF type:complete len:121 (-),score=45.44 TRINITY_DN28009_c0_g1_i1:337-699(-)
MAASKRKGPSSGGSKPQAAAAANAADEGTPLFEPKLMLIALVLVVIMNAQKIFNPPPPPGNATDVVKGHEVDDVAAGASQGTLPPAAEGPGIMEELEQSVPAGAGGAGVGATGDDAPINQ